MHYKFENCILFLANKLKFIRKKILYFPRLVNSYTSGFAFNEHI